jgi:hypothetical protein
MSMHTTVYDRDDEIVLLRTFLTPPVAGADLRAALVANCLRGALPPVDLRAVCFVRAMLVVQVLWSKTVGECRWCVVCGV